jgi:hypothetical protein
MESSIKLSHFKTLITSYKVPINSNSHRILVSHVPQGGYPISQIVLSANVCLPDIDLSSDLMDFGSVMLGRSRQVYVMLTNSRYLHCTALHCTVLYFIVLYLHWTCTVVCYIHHLSPSFSNPLSLLFLTILPSHIFFLLVTSYLSGNSRSLQGKTKTSSR